METLQELLNFVLHLDVQLVNFVNLYGIWTYVLLFCIIFCETGLVIIPFLPGDSLLFAAGTLAAGTSNILNIHVLFILLMIASITGNGLNYFLGRLAGPKIFYSPNSWIFNKKYLLNAHRFYERFGGKTIIIARFIPVIRTFAPFVAGIGDMGYRRFYAYNIIGATLWIGSLLYTSYWVGNLHGIKEHFSLVILLTIILSLLAPLIGLLKHACSKA